MLISRLNLLMYSIRIFVFKKKVKEIEDLNSNWHANGSW